MIFILIPIFVIRMIYLSISSRRVSGTSGETSKDGKESDFGGRDVVLE